MTNRADHLTFWVLTTLVLCYFNQTHTAPVCVHVCLSYAHVLINIVGMNARECLPSNLIDTPPVGLVILKAVMIIAGTAPSV